MGCRLDAKIKSLLNEDDNFLYDKQQLRSILTKALKSSQTGREMAKDDISVCPQCGKSVRNRNIRRHLLSHIDLPYRCSRCSLFFKTHSALEEHRLDKHVGKFICSYCGVEYRFRNSLTEHIQTRHEGTGKIYECEVCGVKMCRKSHLDDHMNVHNNVNPYSCVQCNNSYKNKSAYNRHVKDCGKGNKYACNECGQIYKSDRGLQDHMKRCHDNTDRYLLYCVCGASFRTRAARCRHRLHCETYQTQKHDQSQSTDGKITILRVTTPEKIENNTECVYSQIKPNANVDSLDNHEGMVPQHLPVVVEQAENQENTYNHKEIMDV